jgi:hypothetical protein
MVSVPLTIASATHRLAARSRARLQVEVQKRCILPPLVRRKKRLSPDAQIDYIVRARYSRASEPPPPPVRLQRRAHRTIV